MKTKTENLKHTHICVFADNSVKKVAVIGEACDGELMRVTWRERHTPIPGHGFFVDLEEYVSIDFLIPIYGWEGDEE